MGSVYTLGHKGKVLARCPHCDWSNVFPNWQEATIGGLTHARQCERA